MSIIILEDSKQNKLALVNRCLQAIGEAPLPSGTIPSEFPLGSDAQVASSIVDDTWVEVLNRGWWFNTDKNFPLQPDESGIIAFPASVLRIDSGRHQSYVKREGMLYDTSTHSFTFTNTIYLDLIWATNYSDLPVAVYEYIACRASKKFYKSIIGATEQYGILTQDEQDALTNLQKEHSKYRDASLIEPNVSYRFTNPSRSW